MSDREIKTSTAESNSSNTANSRKKPKRKKDPRDIVTPDAFTLSDEVLGQRLASPKRRGIAMLIDLLIIQQISQMGSLMLGAAIAVLLVLLGTHRKRGAVGTGLKKYAFIAAAVITVGVILYEIYLFQDQQEFHILRDKPEVAVAETEINPDADLATQLAQAKERIDELEDRGDWEDQVEGLAETFSYSFGWAAIYFTLCLYLSNGQTIGKWLTRIQVRHLDGSVMGIWAAFGRYGGYAASFVTGLSGFFQIYWDANRQGLHDKVANTVVIDLRHARKITKKKMADAKKPAEPDPVAEPVSNPELTDQSEQDTSRNS